MRKRRDTTEKKALTLRLEKDVWRHLSHLAVDREANVTDLIVEAIRQHFNLPEGRPGNGCPA